MGISAPIIGIVRHSINVDGEGVCTLVAFHTCTLRCKFCLNPQSLTNVEKCEVVTPEQLCERVKIDDLYFQASNGGITFGGGEPMLRTDFIKEFKKICPSSWKICVETALNIPQENIKELITVIDNYFVDIKDIDEEIYKNYTGKSNNRVIDNLKFLCEQKLQDKVIIRVPLIPDFNTKEDQDKSVAYLRGLGFNKFDRFTYIIK